MAAKDSKKTSVKKVTRLELRKRLITKYGKETVQGPDKKNIKVYSTGIIDLDIALGTGGLPRGRTVELFGPESSGKTLVMLQAMSFAYQRYKKPSVFIDLEHATPVEWLEQLGLTGEGLDRPDPSSSEEAFAMMIDYINSDLYAYIVLDSIAGLLPMIEDEKDVGDAILGVIPRQLAQFFRKAIRNLGQTETCVVFINQLRMKIGQMFGNPEETPGGRAVKFFAAQRIDLRRKASSVRYDEVAAMGKVAVGHTVKARIVKNKLAPPGREGEFDIIYGEGIDSGRQLFSKAHLYSIITHEKKIWRYGTYNAKSKEQFISLIREDAILYDALTDELLRISRITPSK